MQKHSLDRHPHTYTNLAEHAQPSAPLSAEQYDSAEAIHHPNSQDFKESGAGSLREFFQLHESAVDQRKRAGDFAKTMREFLQANRFEELSFAHDNEGTMSVIYNHRGLTDEAGTYRNYVDIARYNPLDATSETTQESFEAVPLAYEEDGSTTAAVQLITGDVVAYHLSATGSYTVRQDVRGIRESSPLIYARNLDYELAYDHPEDPNIKTRRLAKEAISRTRAYHGL